MSYLNNPQNSSEEKLALEHQAAKIFMRCYEKQAGQEIRHIWHNQPRKPDVSCKLEGEQLDLEIAHLYGSELEAMTILNRKISERTLLEIQHQALEDIDQRLLCALQQILSNKATKYYESERVWLVIRNAHPDWSAAIISDQSNQLVIPDGHPFEQIWIIGDMEGKSGIVRLYPSQQA